MEDLTYRRLLDLYYLHETPIPLDITETARQIRMRSHSDCITLVLQEYFERTDDGWVHHRANKEIAKTGEKSEKASASAKARWNKAKDANALPTQSESNATHNTEHITQDTQPKEKAKQPYQALFDVFWVKYPKKVGKDAALKAFQKRKPDQAMLHTMLDAVHFQRSSDAWQRDGGQYIPNPATWLNQGRWQDEVTNFKPVDLIHQTTPTPPNQDAALRKIEEDSKRAAKPNAEVQARIAELLNRKVV